MLNRKLTDTFTIELFLSGYDSRRVNVASLKNSLVEWYVVPPPTGLDSFCKNNPLVDMCVTAHRRDIKGKAARLRSHAGAEIKATFAIMNGKRLSDERLKKMLPSELAHLAN
ncbi:MAG: hypothetical protein MI867_26105 [Pseudomonadales bacterium]|nr:hypothetical protein [Pseudomonadales bacterium]